jgi:hypothetical protein
MQTQAKLSCALLRSASLVADKAEIPVAIRRQKIASSRKRKLGESVSLSVMKRSSVAGCLCAVLAAIGRAAPANEQTASGSSVSPAGNTSPAPPEQNASAAGTNSPITLPAVTVTGDLDRARDQIAPSLGAVTYTIGPNQIQSLPQGENAPFSQVLLRAPGVVADSFGEVHVRGEHGDLTYRVNGVLLPEGLFK